MSAREHGGGVDAAVARWGGQRAAWLDLSTGINPIPYPISGLGRNAWTALPDQAATKALETAARSFWSVPHAARVVIAPGVSPLIRAIPRLRRPAGVRIDEPTYNEHWAAFSDAGWTRDPAGTAARVIVHPNNPDGRLWGGTSAPAGEGLLVIDESFCDTCPGETLVGMAARPGVIVLKSFGKFWGLGGLRLGFAVGRTETVDALADTLGPWPVSGAALEIGAQALADQAWAERTRERLEEDAARLDVTLEDAGARLIGGTTLFRTYDVGDGAAFQEHVARTHVLVRTFAHSPRWVRIGLPGPEHDWDRLEAALA